VTPTDDEIRAKAIEEILVESTMFPFDIGPCYVTGPIDFAKKHSGELLRAWSTACEWNRCLCGR
jgi:hypothetical protein